MLQSQSTAFFHLLHYVTVLLACAHVMLDGVILLRNVWTMLLRHTGVFA